MTEILNIDRAANRSPRPRTSPPDRFCNRYRGDMTVVILASAFIAAIALGMFLGDVFEVYHTGSSL